MFLALVPVLGSLCVVSAAQSSTPHRNRQWRTTAHTMVTSAESSSVLSELKETIRKQAAEIEELKRKAIHVSGAIGVTPHSHAPNGAGEVSVDELARYLDCPFYTIASQRVGWLGLFMVSLSLTALIMSGFEHILSQEVELAFFVPFLAGHGGNTGGQAVGTVLSALSAGVVSLADAPKVIFKESLSGLTMGIVLGSIVGPVAHYAMGISLHVSTVICCTLPLISTIAATLGSAIPFACVAMGLNPSVIAAPAMTSLVDVSGLWAYFLIANRIFGFIGIKLK